MNQSVNHLVNHQILNQPATERFLPTPLRRHTGSDRLHAGRFSHPTISQSLQRVNHLVNHQLFSQPATEQFLPAPLHCHTGYDRIHVGRSSHPTITQSLQRESII